MPSYPGRPSAHRHGDVAGTLRLLAYLAAAVALMVLDHRGAWLAQVRQGGEVAMQPVWWLAGLPGRIGDSARGTARTHASLVQENRALRNALLLSGAQVARLQASADENQRIRGLLRAARAGGVDVQLVPILDIDLDPSRQRLVLAGGSDDGVRVGQAAIDGGGLVGQIIAATPSTATVLLLTDPAHAVPVEVARSGVRLVAYGNGRSDQLVLANVPLSSDVRVGDSVVTSGLGRRFPAGFAVGRITALRPDDSRAFLLGEVRPAAQLDRGREVLLLRAGSRGAGLQARNNQVQAAADATPATAFGVQSVAAPAAAAQPVQRDAPGAASVSSTRPPGTAVLRDGRIVPPAAASQPPPASSSQPPVSAPPELTP